MHAIGATGDVAGQPAWPFAQRVAVENLLIDRGLARHLAMALAATVAAVLLLGIGAAWRRGRWPVWLGAVVLALIAPWPPLALTLTDATPASFHRSPTKFQAASIDRGLSVYAAKCLACHGADGRGEGPAAASLPVWPPTLSAGLLWKRSEGELLWRVLHGMHSRDGAQTMPGFGQTLTVADAWAVLDGMKALSAGESAQRESSWPWPVRAPLFEVDCDGQGSRPLADMRGQRVRIVAGPLVPAEDPRLITVLLKPGATSRDSAGSIRAAGCTATTRAAWHAYAAIAGVPDASLAGTQFIVDRDGWLRALGRPGQSAWSESSLLCKSDAPATSATTSSGDGLGELIARMDADPVRSAALGLPHGR